MNCLAGFVFPIYCNLRPFRALFSYAGKSIFEYGPSHNMYLVLKIVFLLIRKMLFFARAIINILLLQCNDWRDCSVKKICQICVASSDYPLLHEVRKISSTNLPWGWLTLF